MIFKSFQASDAIKVIFVDKDFTQKKVLEDLFPNSRILLCAFHVIKVFKTEIAKENLSVNEKQALLASFKELLYSPTEDAFYQNESKFTNLCSDQMSNYYKENWGNIVQLW